MRACEQMTEGMLIYIPTEPRKLGPPPLTKGRLLPFHETTKSPIVILYHNGGSLFD